MRTGAMIFLAVIILGVFGYTVYESETLKNNGKTVLLELAPIDPRSLLQGDYMVLGFAVERVKKPDYKKHNGYMVLEENAEGIAQFKRFYEAGEALTPNEYKIRFVKKWSRFTIRPNSFLFQEGHRKHYDKAKYGIFKFDKDQNYLLVGLADETKQSISPK
ncbi:MAG: GDYXXLXY domain-containing protein [Methyloligellaceae bacterium]